MSMSKELFLAILSMDAYSRGNNSALGAKSGGLGGPGRQIGNATVDEIDDRIIAEAASFFAVSYDWNGEKVISYHGTDQFVTDALTGWSVGAGLTSGGFLFDSQAALAQQFYTLVTKRSPFEAAAPNVTSTGHSPGGGLAGFISALTPTAFEADRFEPSRHCERSEATQEGVERDPWVASLRSQ